MNTAKTIILIDADMALIQNVIEISKDTHTNCNLHLIATLRPDGTWSIIRPTANERWIVQETPHDLLDIFSTIAEKTNTDLNSPQPRSPICTCPTSCDCACPNDGLMSNECPIHNDHPQPNPDCPQHGQI